MHVQFKVHGSGKKNLHGDGIAIWYTKERLHPGNLSLLFHFIVLHMLILHTYFLMYTYVLFLFAYVPFYLNAKFSHHVIQD